MVREGGAMQMRFEYAHEYINDVLDKSSQQVQVNQHVKNHMVSV